MESSLNVPFDRNIVPTSTGVAVFVGMPHIGNLETVEAKTVLKAIQNLKHILPCLTFTSEMDDDFDVRTANRGS